MFNERENTVAIAILDFGSQFTHLISRRLDDNGTDTERSAFAYHLSRHVFNVTLTLSPDII